MIDNVKQIEKNRIIETAKSFVLTHFDIRRIESFVLYGSSLSEGERYPKDYDFILLLDTYNPRDMDVLKKLNNQIPVELFIDYKDHIISKGVNNYQRGRHGVYFFVALAYGQCCIGNNYYLNNLKKVDYLKVKQDLLFRIEEYFYRIQKHYLNKKDFIDVEYIKKYIARIFYDILLFNGTIEFSEMHKIHYLDILDQYVYTDINMPDKLLKLVKGVMESNKVENIPELIGMLYNLYLSEFQTILK